MPRKGGKSLTYFGTQHCTGRALRNEAETFVAETPTVHAEETICPGPREQGEHLHHSGVLYFFPPLVNRLPAFTKHEFR